MKKFIALLTILFSTFSFSQEPAKTICYDIDDFTDKKSLNAGSDIYYTDGGDMSSEGMLFIMSIREGKKKKDAKISRVSLIVSVYGMGGCVDEGSTLNVIFEDGSKTELVNWNDFDCEGTNYFNFSAQQIEMFKKSPIKAMRYTNKRSYKSITVKDNISNENKTFIQERLTEVDGLNDGSLVIGVCSDD